MNQHQPPHRHPPIRPLVEHVRHAISSPDGIDKPIFGICLGNQIVGMAAGCKSYKLPFGNRGQNQPVINALTQEVSKFTKPALLRLLSSEKLIIAAGAAYLGVTMTPLQRVFA